MRKTSINTIVIISVWGLSACASTLPSQNVNNPRLEALLSGTTQQSDKIALAEKTVMQAKSDLEYGRIKSALKHANLALRFDPDYKEAKLLVGKALIANGQYKEGADTLTQLAALNPNSENLEYLGISQYYLGDYHGAEISLSHSLAEDSNLWRPAVLLARIKSSQKDFTAADAFFKQAALLSDNAAAVYDHMGHSYVEREVWQEAVNAFNMAYVESNGTVGHHDSYRFAMAQSGDLSKVLNEATASETARLYRDMGNAALLKGDKLKAVENLKKAQVNFLRYDEKTQELMQRAINLPG